MENKDLCHNHNILDLCIKQGYVPPDCTLDGRIVFGLIQESKNPCNGCNINCPHAQKSVTPLEHEQNIYKQYCYEMENIKNKEKERKKEARINKRKTANENNRGFMFIDTNIGNRSPQIIVMVMKPLQERMFVKKFDDINTAMLYIPAICRIYDIRQIYTDINGYGLAVSDALFDTFSNNTDMDIDIVPMRATGIQIGF